MKWRAGIDGRVGGEGGERRRWKLLPILGNDYRETRELLRNKQYIA